MLLWRELCGEEPPAPGEAEAGEQEPVILLDDRVEEPPAEQLPPALVLSKFRRAPGPDSTPDRAVPSDVRLRLVSRF